MRPIRPALYLVALLLAVGSGCAYSPYYAERPYERPDHYYDYYYYPHASVYFHLYSGYYYYPDGSRWIRTRVLPSHIHIDQRVRRPLVVRDDKPYLKHQEHAAQYRTNRHPRSGRDHDQAEREHNRKRYEEYRRRDRPGQRDY